jgi:hypothetical protein
MGLFRFAKALGLYLVNGGTVSLADVKAGAEAAVQQARADLAVLADRAQRGQITGEVWYRGAQDAIKRLHYANAALARGGWAQMRPQDVRAVEATIEEELTRLRRFARNIDLGLIRVNSPGFLHRNQQYADAARATYENTRLDDNAEKRGHNEFKRVLGAADHCRTDAVKGRIGCLEAAAMGWVPADKFILIGGCTCWGGCHCVALSRRSKAI